MKTAYIDCFSGISGDMMVGALIDLGLHKELLEENLGKLSLQGYRIFTRRVNKGGIDSVDFKVEIKGPQSPRNYRDIKEMLEASSLKEEVKSLSLKIFAILAEAEGKVHGVEPDDVHFHEVGGIDSIVDVVGTAIGVDYLGIENACASDIITGKGFVETDHGQMPVPAPATAEILKGVPISGGSVKGEMVTPTGAAILKALSEAYGTMPKMKIESIGYGAGDMDFDGPPNLLRIFLGNKVKVELDSQYDMDEAIVMETAIDDMNPQFFECLVDDLFEAGALDVTMSPLFMKKSRPGTLLHVLAPPDMKMDMARIIFTGSTTIGIRCHKVDRLKLVRGGKIVCTPFGEIRTKVIKRGKGNIELRPEYDDLKRLAREKGISVTEMSSNIQKYLLNVRQTDQLEA